MRLISPPPASSHDHHSRTPVRWRTQGSHCALEMSNEAVSTCLEGERMENSKTVWVIVWRLQVWHEAALPIVSRLCRVDNYIVSMWRLNHICRGQTECRVAAEFYKGETQLRCLLLLWMWRNWLLAAAAGWRMLRIVFWAAACLRTIARTCGTLFSQQCRVPGLVLLQVQTQFYYFLLISKHFNWMNKK